MRSMVVAIPIALAACGTRGGEVLRLPLAPAQLQKFGLQVEAGEATVRLVSPIGYVFQELGGVVLARRQREIGDPEIVIQSVELDPFTKQRKTFALRREDCDSADRPSGQWHVLSRVKEPAGVSLVCAERTAERTRTVVARELTWEGHPVQCEVRFATGVDDERYAEPTPSAARIAEATEICKSMTIQGIVDQQP